MNNQQQTQIYNYSNFFFPFIWKTDEFLTLEEWVGRAKKHRDMATSKAVLYWEQDRTLECIPRLSKVAATEKSRLQYLYGQEKNIEANEAEYLTAVQTMEFFTSAAKNIIRPARNEEGRGKHISCQNYRLCMPSPMTIRMTFPQEEYVPELNVQGIHLKLLEAGFGVLTFRTYLAANQKDSDQNQLKIINRCNEAFRHISMPFYLEKNHPLMPESVTLFCGDHKILQQDWDLKSFRIDYISRIITGLLSKPFSPCDRENPQRENIKRCMDDRMFVHGCYRNDMLSNIAKNEAKDVAKEGNERSEVLYQYLYIENSLTSPTESFRRQELESSLYHRWTAWGTLSGVTPHSFMMVTGESDKIDDSVVLPMVHIYAYMLEIILLQKAALMYFEDRCSSVCQDVKEIVPLHEQYTKVRTYLLINEISTQLQPGEIFRILHDKLGIRAMQEDLAATMEGLFAKVEYNETSSLNDVLLLLTILTLIPTFIATNDIDRFVCPLIEVTGIENLGLWVRLGLLVVSLLFCLCYRWMRRCVFGRVRRFFHVLFHRR